MAKEIQQPPLFPVQCQCGRYLGAHMATAQVCCPRCRQWHRPGPQTAPGAVDDTAPGKQRQVAGTQARWRI